MIFNLLCTAEGDPVACPRPHLDLKRRPHSTKPSGDQPGLDSPSPAVLLQRASLQLMGGAKRTEVLRSAITLDHDRTVELDRTRRGHAMSCRPGTLLVLIKIIAASLNVEAGAALSLLRLIGTQPRGQVPILYVLRNMRDVTNRGLVLESYHGHHAPILLYCTVL